MQMINAKKVTPSIKAAAMIMARLDVAGHFRLPGHALDGGAADASDAEAAPMMTRPEPKAPPSTISGLGFAVAAAAAAAFWSFAVSPFS